MKATHHGHRVRVSTEEEIPAGPFDQVAEWKAQAAVDLGLHGEELVAALSPGPAFPAVLRNMIGALPVITRDTIVVDLGAGIGSISSWVAAETNALVSAIEPSTGSRRAGHRLFPDLDLRAGTASRSGLPDATADVVLMTGVISLLADLAPVGAEVRRLLRGGGVLGIADMFLDDEERVADGVNTLRSVQATIDDLGDQGFATYAVGCADHARPATSWALPAGRLDERLRADHRGEAALDVWLADQAKLSEWIDSGRVIGSYIVCRPIDDARWSDPA